MRILCILNPTAADGLAMQRWPQIVDHLTNFEIEHELLSDRDIPVGEQLTQRFDPARPDEFDVLVGVGGDGTHSQLFNALMKIKSASGDIRLPPYALIPLGTGNNIAKSFGLTNREDFFVNDMRRAVGTIKYGADYHLDLGLINDLYFADAFTIGLDSEILHDRNIRKRKIERIPILRQLVRGNYLLYTWCLTSRVWRKRRRHVQIEIDGEEWYSGPIINMVVNNTRIYGGEFDFTLHAYANDGLLDVIIFTGPVDYLRRYAMALRHNPSAIREMNDALSRNASYRQGRRIHVRAAEPEAAATAIDRAPRRVSPE